MEAGFQYTKPFDWNFHYHHILNNHDNLHHSSQAWEETWITMHWAVCLFTFLLAITRVNLYLIMQSFVWKKGQEQKFNILVFLIQSCLGTNQHPI